jgi:hypothetical protein
MDGMGNTKGSCLTALLAVQSTAHAKGRIERNHGTHQDRLVKKLRRKGIGDLAAANAFLEAEYWVAPNRQFAQEPGSGEDFHVPLGRGVRLDAIFRLEESRTVSKDWVVRYDNRLFQLERESGHAPARSTVLVHEDEGGGIEIRYRGRLMRATEITAGAAAAMATTTAPASPGASAPVRPPAAGSKRPGADHPWRQGYFGIRKDVPLWQVADQSKSLWKLPEPWTHRTRPPLLGIHRTVSTATTRHCSYSLSLLGSERGHFYRVKDGTFLTSLDTVADRP